MNFKHIALVSIAVAAVAAGPAFATCADPAPTFGTAVGAFCPLNEDTGGLCAVRNASLTATARFWGFNQGNFAVDNATAQCVTATCGADNGAWHYNDPDVPWMFDSGVPGTLLTFGDWAGAGITFALIDGCPTTQAGKTRPIMMLGISDQGPSGVGRFAIAWAALSPGAKADYDFSTVNKSAPPNDTGNGGGDIVLRDVPRPFVTGSSNLGGGNRSFSVRSLTLAEVQNGLYGDNSLAQTEAVQGFRVYTRIVPRNAAVPTSDRAAWTAASAVTPLGATADTVVTVNCLTNSDVYLGFSIVGNSGWEGSWLGSSRVGQCGPTLADPPGKGKIVPRPTKNNPSVNN